MPNITLILILYKFLHMPLDSQTKVIKMVLLFNALLEYSLV